MTFTFPQIGSISHVSETGSAVIGKLSTAPADGLANYGLFFGRSAIVTSLRSVKLDSVTLAKNSPSDESFRLGAAKTQTCSLVPIVKRLFHFSPSWITRTQNILVDDDFNFLVVIDLKICSNGSLWQLNHYPMPSPLTFLR